MVKSKSKPFKPADWENDVPQTNIGFEKKISKKTSMKAKVKKKAKKPQQGNREDNEIGRFIRHPNFNINSDMNTTQSNKKSPKKQNRKRKNCENDNSNKLESNSNNNKRIKSDKVIKEDDGKEKLNRTQKKKEQLKLLLQKSNREPINVKSNLREKMLDKLKAAQFRYLNEKLYTTTGSEAQELFKADPVAFKTYHEGYQQQLKKWPVNPIDVIAKRLKKMPKTALVADMGCGEAILSKRINQTVRSFDLVASNPQVEACDIAHTPLLSASMDVTVYCLALMGTNLTQYLVEANRVLKVGGLLLIAEVESRFDDINMFTKEVQRLGFSLVKVDQSHEVFYFMEFKKMQEVGKKSKKPQISLKPCLYKKR